MGNWPIIWFVKASLGLVNSPYVDLLSSFCKNTEVLAGNALFGFSNMPSGLSISPLPSQSADRAGSTRVP